MRPPLFNLPAAYETRLVFAVISGYDKINPPVNTYDVTNVGIQTFLNVKRKDIRELLWDKLPDALSDDQKENKVHNLLAALRKSNVIVSDSSNQQHACWILKE